MSASFHLGFKQRADLFLLILQIGRAYGAGNILKGSVIYREASPTGFHWLDFPLALFSIGAQFR